MLRPTRLLAYTVYSLLTLGAFAFAYAYPSDVTTGLATNLLAGFVIVLFVETLFRLAGEHRLRPMKIATFAANERVREAMEVFLAEAFVAARFASVVTPEDDTVLDRHQIDRRVVAILDRMRFDNLATNDDKASRALRRVAKWAPIIDGTVDTALQKFGSYQEPKTAALLATINELTMLALLRSPDIFPHIKRIAEEEWLKVIDLHNWLLSILQRDAARYGIHRFETLQLFNNPWLLTWAEPHEATMPEPG